MRVLHVISGVDSRAGGPVMAMVGLCKAQRAAGLEVSALATWRQGSGRDAADELGHEGVTVTLVGPTKGPLSGHRHLAAALRGNVAAADVVHAHGIWEDVQHLAARQAQQIGKPYVITPHGMLTPWSLGQKWLKKRIYLMLRLRGILDRAAAIHYTTAAERDGSAALKLSPPAIVEPLGVDLREFQDLPPRGFLRARYPQLQGKRIILFLGRIHPGKGLEYLVPALAKAELPDAMLVVVGPDLQGFQATIEEAIQRHGLRGRVIFTGMLRGHERVEALADADLFALPSEHENFGLVVVEALACGVPVVISDGVAIADEVAAAGVGGVVPVGDELRLTDALARWTTDEALRRPAIERARPFVWARYDWSTVAARWVGHYAKLVGGAASPPTAGPT